MNLLVEDVKAPKSVGDITELLGAAVVVTQSNCEAMNAAKCAAGEENGKPRVKSVKRDELVRMAKI